MTHLNEFCSPSCWFDSSNENEMKYACKLCWAAEATKIEPALVGTFFGQVGEIYGQYRDQYFYRRTMTNGKIERGSVHKNQVKFK